MPTECTVAINGTPRMVPAGLSVLTLLTHLGFEPRLLVIERNGDILHRQDWQTTTVDDGDRYEIVTVVGGG